MKLIVVYLPNPFQPAGRIVKKYDDRTSVSEIAKDLSIPSLGDIILSINGQIIANPEEATATPGDFVVFAPKIASSGGDKNIGAIVGAIALVALTGGMGGTALAGLLGTKAGTLGLGLALYLGGSLLTGNQKAPQIDSPDLSSSAMKGGYNWSPDTIRTQQGNAIPITFGTIETSGQLLVRRITSHNHVQYLYLLLAAGEGVLDSITDIRINDNAITSLDGATASIRLGTNDQITWEVSSVVEQQAFNHELPNVLDADEWIVKTQTEYGTEAVLEFVFPQGCYWVAPDTGAHHNFNAFMKVQYRELGSGAWYDILTTDADPWLPGTHPYGKFILLERSPYYIKVYKHLVPTKLYEFRAQNYTLKRYVPIHGWTILPANAAARMDWLSLTITNREAYYSKHPNVALVALKIPATANISGGMPKIRWKQTRSKIYAWNPFTTSYEQKDATNVAWMVYDLIHKARYLKNTQTGQYEYAVLGEPATNMNYTEFSSWAASCAALNNGAPRAKGNLLVDSPGKMWKVIQDVAASGRGYITQPAGVFTPVWDRATEMTQIFTSGNVIAGSVKGGFLKQRERATAIEARFVDEDNGYETKTILVKGDDYSPTSLDNPTQIFYPALTNSNVVYAAAKYQLRKNKYLLRTLSFKADIDSIVTQIGDVFGFQCDVTNWGVGGRIMGATTTKVVIDQDVTLQPNEVYSVLVCDGDTDNLIRRVVDSVAETKTTNTLHFNANPFTEPPSQYEVYAFGLTNLETKPFTVLDIRRSGDLQAEISAIEYIEGVYTEDGEFPIINYASAGAAINSLTVKADSDQGKLYVSWSTPEDRDYSGSVVFVDGKPKGFFTAEVSNFEVSAVPGGHVVKVIPVDNTGSYGEAKESSITLGEAELMPVSSINIGSELVEQGDGTNLIYITGSMTIPAMAQTVLVEIGEGSTPTSWSTVQDSRAAVLRYGPVKPSQTYSLRFTARNKYATADTVTELVSTAGDAIAPNAPSISATSYLKSVTVAVSLAVVPSDLAGFKIYRHTANSSGAATEVGSVTSRDGRAKYKEEAPEYGVTYYYWAKSFDTWGNLSPFSAVNSTLIVSIEGSDIVDGALNRSELFQAGVVDATAIGNAAVEEAKIAVGAVNTAQINNAALKLPEGPVARWTAKGATTASIAEVNGVKDVSGNGNHGRAFGGVAVVDSEVGKAFSFDAINDYIQAARRTEINTTGTYTFSIWIKWAGVVAGITHQVILLNGAGSGDRNTIVLSGKNLYFQSYDTAYNGRFVGFAANADLWTHIAAVQVGGAKTLYVNGSPVGAGGSSYAYVPAKYMRLSWGGITTNNTGPFNGLMAHPRIYSRALTAAEVKTLYMMTEDATFGTITADLLTTGELITKTAQIKDAIIDDAKIANLDAGKIKTGFLAAARIEAGSITTAKLAAGAVTAEKLLIGKAGSALNPDPNFEDSSAWVVPAGGSLVTITDGQVGQTAARQAGETGTWLSTQRIPFDSSKQYRVKYTVRRVGDPASDRLRMYLGVICYETTDPGEAGSVRTLSPTYYGQGLPISTSWTTLSFIASSSNIPAGTRYMVIRAVFYTTGTWGSAYVDAQDFRIEEVLPATLIQDGAIITDKLAANSVVAGKIAANAVEAAKIAAGAITAEKINVTALKAPAGAVASWSAKGSTTASIAVVGGVKDVSGNGNHGRAFGGVAVVDSEVGKAFSFDAINDYIQAARRTEINTTGTYTFSIWIKWAGVVAGINHQVILLNGAGSGDRNTIVLSGENLYFQSYDTAYNGKFVGFAANADLWTHIAAVQVGAVKTLYVNGVPVGASGTSYAFAPGNYMRLSLNVITTNNTGPFNGLMAHPRVYDRALTAAEVKTLYMLGTDTESGTITADRVVTGELKSLNYSTTAGSMLDLDNGNFTVGGSDNPVFTLNAAAKTGSIAGFTMSASSLTFTKTVGSNSYQTLLSVDNNSLRAIENIGVVAGHYMDFGGDSRLIRGYYFTMAPYAETQTITIDPRPRINVTIPSGISSSGRGIEVIGDSSTMATLEAPLRSSVRTDNNRYGIRTNGKIFAYSGLEQNSTEKVKSDITDFSALDKLKKLPIKQYKLDSDKIAHLEREQEIEKNLREKNAAVCETSAPCHDLPLYATPNTFSVMAEQFNEAFGCTHHKDSIALHECIAVSLRAIQELSAIVDAQKATIKDLCEKLHIAEPDYPVEPEYYLTREEQELIDIADKQTPEQHEHFLKVMEDIEKWERKQK